jgi:hypothetical protein
MTTPTINMRESTALLQALRGGVVPAIGIQHIMVGRNKEAQAVLDTINVVMAGSSAVKFWIGDFGSGKSFMLTLLKTIALKQNFVVSEVDFTPERRLYDANRKAVSTYSAIVNNLSIKTKPDGNALPIIIEKWVTQIMQKVSQDHSISLDQIRNEAYTSLVKQEIMQSINKLQGVGAFEFGLVIAKYYEGYILGDIELTRRALRWLRGEYTTRTDARMDLGVREIIDDANYYDMLKNLCTFFVLIGYTGLVINFDEAINLYKLAQSNIRDKNYEKILAIYNDCMQGHISNLFINIAGTKEFLTDSRRGLYSYVALKSRLEFNPYETTTIRDFSGPVIVLNPLTHEDIYILLTKLQAIFEAHYQTKSPITDANVRSFMEEMFNKPGADLYLTPRQVIREYLNLLSILRENPEVDKSTFMKSIEIEKQQPEADVEIL